MCPKEAGIFIADDHRDFVEILEELLEWSGHRVLVKAFTLDEALYEISQLTPDVQVALLDGNLNATKRDGLDGLMMVRAIHEYAPWVKTVGISMSGKVEGVDINMPPTKISELGELEKIINNL